MNTPLTPRIYVACLASYNAGILHGAWIDLDGSESIEDRIADILKASPEEDAEEWAVHDQEACGQLSEYAGTDTLNAIQEAYEKTEKEGIEWEAFCEFCAHMGHNIEADTVEMFSEAYAGTWNSLIEWCENFLEETGQLEAIPESLRFYFDYAAFARDMEINDVFTIEHGGEVLIFWRH
ncbi:MAG TPA: antirestriction protein ArdA [Opitutae bacterium]|nr:antirestriction protein ArdA [Opitutae bacterium]